MDTQPSGDLSALVRVMIELQAEISSVKTELTEIKKLLTDTNKQWAALCVSITEMVNSARRDIVSELTQASYNSYNEAVKHKIDNPGTIGKLMSTSQEIQLKQPKPNLLKPGKKFQQKYKHHCKVCDGEWIGDEPNPPTCNYCRSRIWQTGRTKWDLRRESRDIGDTTA